MATRRALLSECVMGDIAACDVITKYGVTVIVSGTVLSPYIIDKLKAFGVDSVQIYESGETGEVSRNDVSPQFLSFCDDYQQNIVKMKQILGGLAAGATANRELINQVSEAIYSTIEQVGDVANFIQVLKSSDEYTYTHCINTAYYAMLIGKWVGFSQSEQKTLVQAGLLHDIGKVRIPLELLNKRGVLTREEFETIKKHTVWGHQILEDAGVYEQEIRNAVLLHHERIDGSGYPFSVCADDVGIHAKIVAVADVFDAMTTNRVYKRAVTPFVAFEMFTTVGVGIFDPSIVNAFIKNLAANYLGSPVRLSNGETGKIVFVPPHDVVHPVIAIGDRIVDLAHESVKVSAMLPAV